MTPEDLAARHPRLYHVTTPGMLRSIRRHGLLSTARIRALMGVADTGRRADSVTLTHPDHGTMILTDQKPLVEAGLARCLDDGLEPDDWRAMLDGRAFFWPSRSHAEGLLRAATNRDRARDVLVLDTLGLARAHGDRMALSPINSGNTRRRPARRGLATYTPLGAMPLANWRRMRRRAGVVTGLDDIREVTVEGAVPDAADHLLDVIEHRP